MPQDPVGKTDKMPEEKENFYKDTETILKNKKRT